MPAIPINKLVVLHLCHYAKPKGMKDPLELVAKKGKALRLSTCMRIVYLFNADDLTEEFQTTYNLLTDHVNKQKNEISYNQPLVCERLEGQKAYEFLLNWSLGGLHPEKTFTDQRVRGRIRELWDKKSKSQDLNTKELVRKYVYIINALFADSAQINKLLPTYIISEKGVAKLKAVFQHCAWSRTHGFLDTFGAFNYTHFETNAYLDQLRTMLEKAKSKLLQRVTFSELSSEIVFFKSSYKVSLDNLTGIKKKLDKWEALLKLLPKIQQDDSEDEIEESISLKGGF